MDEQDFELFDNTYSHNLTLSLLSASAATLNPLFSPKTPLKTINLFAPALEFYMGTQNVRQNLLANRIMVNAAAVHNWRTNQRLPDSEMVYLIVGKGLELPIAEKVRLTNCWQITDYVKAVIPCFEEVQKNNDQRMEESLHRMCIQTANQLVLPDPLHSRIKNWHTLAV